MNQKPRSIFGVTFVIVYAILLMAYWFTYIVLITKDYTVRVNPVDVLFNAYFITGILYRLIPAVILAAIITVPVDLIRGLRWKAKQKQLPVTPTATATPASIEQ